MVGFSFCCVLLFFLHSEPLRRPPKQPFELLPQPRPHLVPVAVVDPLFLRIIVNQIVPHGTGDWRRQPQLAVGGLLVDDVGALPFAQAQRQDSGLRFKKGEREEREKREERARERFGGEKQRERETERERQARERRKK